MNWKQIEVSLYLHYQLTNYVVNSAQVNQLKVPILWEDLRGVLQIEFLDVFGSKKRTVMFIRSG